MQFKKYKAYKNQLQAISIFISSIIHDHAYAYIIKSIDISKTNLSTQPWRYIYIKINQENNIQ